MLLWIWSESVEMPPMLVFLDLFESPTPSLLPLFRISNLLETLLKLTSIGPLTQEFAKTQIGLADG